MSTLDSKIKELLNKTEAEKEALIELKTQSESQWKTKGVFITSGQVVLKLKVIQKEKLVELTELILSQSKVKTEALNVLGMSDEDKEVFSLIQGHTIDDWLSDIKKRWAFLELRAREKSLNDKLSKIKDILSEDQLREIEYEKLLKEI